MSTRTALTIQTAEQSGSPDKPSEDRIYLTDSAVILLDGATDPGGLKYSGGWMATQIGTRFQQRLIGDPGLDLAATLESIVVELVGEFDLVAGEAPSTTLAVLRILEDQVDALVVADSPIIIKRSSGELTHVRDDRIAEISERYPRPSTIPDRNDPRWIKRYLAIEAHRNQPGGFWAVSASPEVAAEAVLSTFRPADVESALLMTDGISVLGDHYQPVGWDGLYEALVADPQLAIERTFEAEDLDRACERWPRSKLHDDKAIASVILSQTD